MWLSQYKQFPGITHTLTFMFLCYIRTAPLFFTAPLQALNLAKQDNFDIFPATSYSLKHVDHSSSVFSMLTSLMKSSLQFLNFTVEGVFLSFLVGVYFWRIFLELLDLARKDPFDFLPVILCVILRFSLSIWAQTVVSAFCTPYLFPLFGYCVLHFLPITVSCIHFLL